jgi:hypothetical protein
MYKWEYFYLTSHFFILNFFMKMNTNLVEELEALQGRAQVVDEPLASAYRHTK